ncbi:HAD family hydrolase [Ewingella allii]|uniref:HAD family hydrolase n=1 Tax=Ewingella allii TaxID=3092550 RepID=UPI003789E01F
MKAIIFDLDKTLFDTESCDVYLRTRAGRDAICGLLRAGVLNTPPVDPRIVAYVNALAIHEGIDVYIFSDSPQEYCETVLEINGIRIEESKVFGAQHKPCIPPNPIFSNYENVLIIGDSPRDIYLGHIKKCPTIFFTPLTNFDIKFITEQSQPTAVAENLDVLAEKIKAFYQNEMIYVAPDIERHFLKASIDESMIVDIPSEDIGYSKQYIPDPGSWRPHNQQDKYTWFNVRRVIKPSKDLTPEQLEEKFKMQFYNADGKIGTSGYLHQVAYHSCLDFITWIQSKNITGDIYLIATPASVPLECNHSFPMYQVAQWWCKWLYMKKKNGQINFKVSNGSCVERFWPTVPAHMSTGVRLVLPHLDTLGVFKDTKPFPQTASAVIILDDIVTSGSQMKAVATLLKATNIVPEEVPIYGYALAKTYRPGSTFEATIAAFIAAEKAGA